MPTHPHTKGVPTVRSFKGFSDFAHLPDLIPQPLNSPTSQKRKHLFIPPPPLSHPQPNSHSPRPRLIRPRHRIRTRIARPRRNQHSRRKVRHKLPLDVRSGAEEANLQRSMADDELRHWSQVAPVEHGVELEFPVEIFEVRGGDHDGDEEMGGCEDDGKDLAVEVAAWLEGGWGRA